jgi:hypothetical protein
VVANSNVLLEPNGTGIVQSTTDLQVNAASRLRLAATNSTNFVGLRAPETVSSNITYTLPGTGVTNNTVLRTDASGNLTWVAPFINLSNQTADTATYYPTIVSATSGSTSTVSVSDSRLTFQPSTGTLSSTLSRVTSTTASNSTTTGALVVSGGIGTSGNVYASGIIRFTNTTASTSTSTGAVVISGGLGVAGALNAISKSFDIIHPLDPQRKLRHGSLEGPEFGVYYRGRLTNSNIIDLPDYWKGLVHKDSITVNFTGIGRSQDVWVEEIADNKIVVGGSNIDVYYVAFGERKDIDKLVAEE